MLLSALRPRCSLCLLLPPWAQQSKQGAGAGAGVEGAANGTTAVHTWRESFSIFNFQFSISNDKHKVARGKHVQPALGGLCWIYTVTKTICCPYGMYTNTHTHVCMVSM